VPLDREDRLISWLRARADAGGAPLLGDDAALLALAGEHAVTVDQQIAGVHFPRRLAPDLVARRLLRVSLSDLAAVGAAPRYALLALAAPRGFDHRAFFRALVSECRRFALRLAGGDLARASGLRGALTLIGARPPRGRWLRRSAARPGDALWVGGTLGEAAVGCRLVGAGAGPGAAPSALPERLGIAADLRGAARRAVRRHLLPEPQLALGRWLGRARRAAAIDLSDGFARDLHRLCRESGVAADVDAAALPLAPGHAALAHALGTDPQALALGGGEDYVLLFALPPALTPPARFSCHRVGVITASRRLRLRDAGRWRPLPDVGFDHLSPRARSGR